MELRVFMFILGCFCFFPNLVISQDHQLPGERIQSKDGSTQRQESAREKEAREFAESAFDRDMDQLFESISRNDGNGFNMVAISGMTDAVTGRINVVFIQVLNDVRVTKLRELLAVLPEDEAAQRVSQEFENKYHEFKEGLAELFDPQRKEKERNPESFSSQPAAHGLAATLYLSSEFCDHDQFVGKYRRWLKWYHNEGFKRFTERDNARKNVGKDAKSREEFLKLFAITGELQGSGCPDRLFFINLCGLRALRRGIEPDILNEWLDELNQEFDFELPEIRLIETNRFDPATNQARPEKIVFPLIWGYGTAGILDVTVGWDHLTGEFKKENLRVGNAAVSMAIEWSRPNVIRTWARKIMKSLTDWSIETFGWPEQKEPIGG